MSKKILILGGARFHGLRLVEHFSKKGEEVYVLNRGNYRSCYSPNVKHITADRNNSGQLKKIFKNLTFDVIIDNNGYNDSQIKSSLELLKCKHYIFTSTIAVYLKLCSEKKIKEEEARGVQDGFYSPAINGYSLGKLAAEECIRRNHSNINYTIVRLPNIFGEHDFAKKLTYFYNKLKSNEKIFLENEIKGFNLLYVEDVPKIFELIVQNENCYGKTINFGDPKIYTYNEFFNIIYGELYSKEKIILLPANEIWEKGKSIPFAFGPIIDTSLSEKLIGKIDYTQLHSWGKKTLKWELEND